MATQRKIDSVQELTEKMSKAKSIVFADYRGLTHKQLEELRKALRKVQAEFVIAKNTLILKALAVKEQKITSSDLLTGPTATLFSYSDEVSGLKEMVKFAKTLSLPKIKFGFLGAQELTEAQVTNLSKLPGKDILLAQLVGQMKSPLYGLHRALNWNLQKFVLVLSAIKKGGDNNGKIN